MRKNAFDEYVIESADDDLSIALADIKVPYHAVVGYDDVEKGFYFDILEDDGDEQFTSSEAVFETADATKAYLKKFNVRAVDESAA